MCQGESLTYRQLDQQANRLARHLIAMGLGREGRVGVCLGRSNDVIAALLAILKAGGAYVPLDPAYPRERLSLMVEDAGIELLITERRHAPLFAPAARTVLLDADREAIRRRRDDGLPRRDDLPGSLAYIIYTSGSTGRPKGVMVGHRNVANFFHAMDRRLGEEPGCWLAVTSISFDISVLELLWTLSRGSRVVIRAPEETETLAAQILRAGVTHLQCTPSALATISLDPQAPAALSGLRRLLLGGEALPLPLAGRVSGWLSGELLNLYGPTETTIWSAVDRVDVAEGLITLGRPIANTELYVVDRRTAPLPVGQPGELLIGGDGVVRGYWERPDLTAERFVPDPFSGRPGARLYRTGDLALRRPDGRVVFLGRIDHQVKILGHRVELGEIERTLTRHASVREAVVVAREESTGDLASVRLVAYVVPAAAGKAGSAAEPGPPALSIAELRSYAQEILPSALRPAVYVVLSELPLTPNGKVDRRALPIPERGRPDRDRGYVPPGDELQRAICQAWSDLLRVDRVGIRDNFFELGGNSLLLVEVHGRLRRALGREIPLRTLLNGQTVEDLARSLGALGSEEEAAVAPPVRPVPRSGLLPLSFAQERLWFLDRLVPGNATYNIPLAARITGPLRVGLLASALNEVARRHEALRTTFTDLDGRTVQVIAPHLSLAVPVADLRALPLARRETEKRRLVQEHARRPFDLERGPLLRMTVLAVAPEEHVMLLTMHHIVADGWSTGVLLREMAALLPALAAGEPSPLPDLPLQYADFAVWQRRWFSGEALARETAWWHSRLAGASGVLELPTDRPRPAEQTFRGATEWVVLPPEIVNQLGVVARRYNATSFMVLLAGLDLLLLRTSGQADIAVATAPSGRTRTEVEGLIGFFANTVVLRVDAGGDPRFPELLDRVREAALGAYAHQEIPFERLVEELQPRRDLSRSPLFQIMFALQSAEALGLPGLRLELLPVDSGTAKFDLTWMLVEDGDRITVSLEHNRDLFESATIRRMLRHWQILLAGLASESERRLSAIPWLDEGERHQLLTGWNDTAAPAAAGSWIQEGFEARAAASPAAPAVIWGEEVLSYGDLDAAANRLAWHLRSLGIEPGDLVGIGLDRSPDLLIGLLAVLKAGAGYVPLDLAYPRERLAYMLKDSGARLVLTRSDLGEGCWEDLGEEVWIVRLDQERAALAALPGTRPPRPEIPVGLAYIIYTSGSTGLPKGVLLRHEPVINLIEWVNRTFGVGPDDRLLFVTSPSFDLSVYDVFGILAAGGVVRIASSADLRDPEELVRLLREDGITFWDSAPAALQQLVPFFGERREGALRLVFFSGDWIPVRLPDQVREAFPGARVIALGGATEATIWSNSYVVGKVPAWWPSIPYGRPIRNSRYLVLDPWLEPCPIGVPGDLHIGGDCLAVGYACAPAVTAGKFLPDPWSEAPGGRLYRTGDRARFLSDGNIEFLGRLDAQVKIRGFRIELGEIEGALARHPEVRESAVLVREDAVTGKRLVAYAVPRPGVAPSPRDLRGSLQKSLPEHMVPSSFVLLEALPLTSNGKVDRAALLRLETVAERGEEGFAPPATPQEETLAAIWAETLGLPRVGIHDNFFELGGDSILSVQVVARAQRAGLPVSARDIFRHQTVAELAAALPQADAIQGGEEAAAPGPVPLTPIQHWFFAAEPRSPHWFNQSLLLTLAPTPPAAHLAAAVRRIVAAHDALRLRFVASPGGWLQEQTPEAGETPFTAIDLASLPPERRRTTLETAAAWLQASLDLGTGPLFRTALFNVGSGEPARLLLIAHHLIVDGVSWRILLDDVQEICAALATGREPAPLPRTASFRRWAETLDATARRGELDGELVYWEALAAATRPERLLPLDDPAAPALEGSSGEPVVVELGAEATATLLQEAPRLLRARLDEVLLAALSLGLASRRDDRRVLVDLEAHGREALADLDLTRTVGWFTSLFPVELALEDEPGAALRAVKEHLRAVPRGGAGFGALRWLAAPEIRGRMSTLPRAEIVFNYLGQLDRVTAGGLARAPESPGPDRAPEQARRHLLEITASVAGGRLRVEWRFDRRLRRETVEKLAEAFRAALVQLMELAQGAEAAAWTASDFPLAGMDSRVLAAVLDVAGSNLEDIYPLTPVQQGILFHSLYEPGSGIYFEQFAYGLRGALDGEAFAAAWWSAFERHPALRTSFLWRGLERPLQVVSRRAGDPLERLDWRGLPEGEAERRWENLLATDAARGFELDRPPLSRLVLVRLADEAWRLLWSYHHLLLDGWSQMRVLSEVLAGYQAAVEKRPAVLPVPRRYRDHVEWLNRQDLAAAESWWRETLRGFEEPTPLPLEPPSGVAGDRHESRFRLSAEVTAELVAAARRHQLTPAILLHGAWALLLGRYSGQEDLVYGAVVSGREHGVPGIADMVGLFINTLPVRVSLRSSEPFVARLCALQEWQSEMRRHEHTPLVEIQGWSEVPRGSRLFDSIVVVENYPVEAALREWSRRLAVEELHVRERTGYALTVNAVAGDELAVSVTAEPLFAPAAVERLAGHLRALLEGIAERPEGTVGDLPLLSGTERQQLLREWNDTGVELGPDLCLHELFEDQVARTPEAVALSFRGETLSYARLDGRANRLARHLRELGVGLEVRVGVAALRSFDLVVGLLAVLKAGGAYVPLDPSYPRERLSWLLADASISVLLVQDGVLEGLELPAGKPVPRQVSLGRWATGEEGEEPRLPAAASPASLAYVIYTSGSTGRPKGAMNAHRGVVNRLRWMQALYRIGPDDRVLQKTPFSFDVSVWEIFWPLLSGSRMVLAEPGRHGDGPYLLETILREGITTIHFVPSLLREFVETPGLERCGATLQRVVASGEALPRDLASRWAARTGVPLDNLYGPTEAAVEVTWWRYEPGSDRTSVPIGRPVANTILPVLGPDFRPMPIGVPGELCIGGLQVGRGYLGRPALTAERFVPDSVSGVAGARLYLTGDLARWRSDGVIEYLGRLDHQVKIRGFRIEPGEIEAALAAAPSVREAVVVAREDRPGDVRLVAYVIRSTPEDPIALRRWLAERLPEHMVPSAFVDLEVLPLNPNGKLDRRALPAPGDPLGGNATAPRTPVEEVLTRILAEVLGRESFGVAEDFFAAGGHSLLAARVVARVRAALGVEIPLRAVFEHPAPVDLAARIEELRRRSGGLPSMPPLRPAARGDEALPLSFAQRRLWFIHQLEPGSPLYNMPVALRVEGPLNSSVLALCLAEVVRRHEALRTVFDGSGGEPVQTIQPAVQFVLPIVDLSELPERTRETEALRLAGEEAGRPFDLTTGPLLRGVLVRLAREDHVVTLTLHHIVSDGWSTGILVREVTILYAAFVEGRPSPLPELPVQYADFALWQGTWLQGEVLESEMSFWRHQLAGLPACLELPGDRPRPAQQSFRGDTRPVRLPAGLARRLETLGRREGATVFMALLAGFQVLLARYSGQQDLAVGTPIAGRNRIEIEGLIGFFVNTLVLRGDLSGERAGGPSFRELLGRVREVALAAYMHQDLPFEKLVQELAPERSLSHAPLFQVMFVLQNAPAESLEIRDLRLRPVSGIETAAKFDLTLSLEEQHGGLYGSIGYASDLFDRTTIDRLILHYEQLLAVASAASERRVGELALLTPAEQSQLILEWNDTARSLASPPLVHHLIARRAVEAPEAVAVACDGRRLTFRELALHSDRLEAHLRALSVGPDVLVALFLERSVDLIVALLAVLKAGGAYLPLEVSHPRDRVAALLADSRAPLVLTRTQLLPNLPESSSRSVCLDDLRELPAGELPAWQSASENLAYVLYTSGSTGRPKGVAVTHRGLVNYLLWAAEAYPAGAGRGAPVHSPISFDLTVTSLFLPLLAGSGVVLVPEEQGIEALAGALSEGGFGLVKLTPAHLEILSRMVPPERAAGCAAAFVIGGEPLSGERLTFWRDHAPGLRLFNEYGPTETVVGCCVWEIPAAARPAGPIPIGRPIANCRIQILDSSFHPVPIGVPGELCIGGEGVCRGYLHLPDLTAERFVPDPFGARGDRLYRSGDLARTLADGTLEYLGRIDHQIKLRGFRIEPGEIEAAISSLPGAREAVVMAREDTPGDRRLVAYVTGDVSPGALRQALRERLPDYMVPAAFVVLATLPLTPNGKLDKSALPSPDLRFLGGVGGEPETVAERGLAEVWARVLRLPTVGLHDNFFALGGDSILALQVVSGARTAGLRLTPRQIFQHQTLVELAASADLSAEPGVLEGPAAGEAPLSPIQSEFFARELPDLHHYNQAALLEIREAIAPGTLERALAAILEHHDALRLRFRRQAPGIWRQSYAPARGTPPFTILDLSSLPAEARAPAFQRAVRETQASLDLAQGPLLRAALLSAGEGPDHLLLAVHHLVIDGVSWRILLEDLESACAQAAAGRPVTLPPRTASFGSWTRALHTRAASAEVQAELGFWQAQGTRPVPPLPVDGPPGAPDTEALADTIEVVLDPEETRSLLTAAPRPYRARVDELLLTALARALARWTGSPRLRLDLEGHGRDEAMELDVSRTVGWFTSRFPVVVDLSGAALPGEALRRVKEQLRAIPAAGLGYGLLCCAGPATAAGLLSALPPAEISFNYLGQLEVRQAGGGRFQAIGSPVPGLHSPYQPRRYRLEIDAAVVSGSLRLVCTFGTALYRRATLESLAGWLREELTALRVHCLSPQAGGLTPSDVPLAGVDQEALDRFGPELDDLYPLAPLQQGLLFHLLHEPETGAYFLQMACVLAGPVDAAVFEDAWRELMARHPILRTSFHWQGLETALQAVWRRVDVPVEHLDWSAAGPAEVADWWAAMLRADQERGFDPGTAPLLRLTLVRTGPAEHRLLWSFHHLVLDGWSLPLVLREVLDLYESLRHGERPVPARPPLYRTYIEWLRQQDRNDAEVYWRATLAGITGPTPLGIDHAPATGRRGRSLRRTERLPEPATEAVQSAARRMQVTLNTLVQGAWALLLHHYGGSDDVIFGAVTAGRPAGLPGADRTPGLFINTLPVRVRIPAGARLASWLRDLQERQAEARQHEHSPLVDIQGWSEVPRGVPLFHSILAFESYPVDESLRQWRGSFEIREIEFFERTTYPLTVVAAPAAELLLEVGYDAARFDEPTIVRLLRHLAAALEGIAADPEGRLEDLQLLGPAERHQLLWEWNDSRGADPRDLPLYRLFELQAEATPGAVAVSAWDETLTFRELEVRANRLAHHLAALGVEPETLVGLCLERSVDLVVSILAVHKAGGAYVPLDPGYPRERLRAMLEDARPALILTRKPLTDILPAGGPPRLALDAETSAIARRPPSRLSAVEPDRLAYVLFTSGSTGRPKGVMVTHRAIANRVLWMQEAYPIGPDTRVALKTPFSFDASIWEIFLPLVTGARMVLARPGGHQDPAYLARWVAAEEITVLQLVPSMLQVFAGEPAAAACTSLRRVFCGGEALPAGLRRRVRELWGAELHNLYGPTEAAIDASSHRAWDTEEGIAPIGRPITHLRIHLLDPRGRPAPLGAPGELHIGGLGLARGYVRRPDLTAERFVPDPFAAAAGERLYRTGDLARRRLDGALEYLGRADDQVKIRGIRIELGDVEAALASHPEVREAAAAVRGEQLVGYVVPAARPAPPPASLSAWLRERLPESMVPQAILFLEALPVAPNGKLDRRALPDPAERPAPDGDFVAPRSSLEETLAALWSDVLGVERVGARDDFFALGGHSLLATRIVARVRESLGMELPLRDLFDFPTVAALAGRISSALRPGAPASPPLVRRPRTGPAPLSFAQQRLWLVDQLEPGSAAYNLPHAGRISGPLEAAVLSRALAEVAVRHEALRSVLREVDGEPLQETAPPPAAGLPVADLSDLPAERREPEAMRLAAAEARRPFDLARGPLLRSLLIRLGSQDHLLLYTLHHIVSDAWSLGLLVREVAVLYDAFRTGRPSPLPALALQYADFAVWQREWLQGEVLAVQVAHWKERLAGAPPVIELPLDRPRPRVRGTRGGRRPFHLPPAVVSAATALARREGVSPFMVLLAAFNALLCRYGAGTDLIVGAPVANRSRREIEDLIGFFVNTLVLRTDLSGEPGFREALARTRKTVLDASMHQEVPFEKLVEELAVPRDLSRTPLFQVALAFQELPRQAPFASGLRLSPVEIPVREAKFDLLLDLVKVESTLAGGLDYAADLFDGPTIDRLLKHYASLLAAAVERPDLPVPELPLLDPAERWQTLGEWSGNAPPRSPVSCLHELFAVRAAASPEATAVVCGEASLSYRELDRRANVLAHHLRSLGVESESCVALCLDRSLDMIVALLGVLKAGAAYLPLDPAHPPERLARLVEDAGASLAITAGDLKPSLPVRILRLDEVKAEGRAADRPPATGLSPDNAAYVIYTSGSTGSPKGVVVTHANVARLFDATRHWFGFGADDAWTLFHSYAFDFSVWEIWGALLSGGRLVIVPTDSSRSPQAFHELLRRERVTVLNQTPSAFRQLAAWDEEAPQPLSLRWVIFGGEPLDASDLRGWIARRGDRSPRLVNMYGITETTVHVTYRRVLAADVERPGIPIGAPIPDLRVYVLDSALRPLPVGVPGQIHVGGMGLARGYLGRPGLTAERFVPDPFSGEPGARLYVSGDLGRSRPNGELEHLGRADQQVKIRGFRIEPGEIEAELARHPALQECVVLARGSGEERRLVAYVVPRSGRALGHGELRDFLKETLPEHMLPSAFVSLAALPLTVNGKLDRGALPEPGTLRPELERVYVEPRTVVEKLIAGVWTEVLQLERVGAEDEFFELGGHSLLATRVVARLRRIFQVDLPLRVFFEAPTLQGLAQALEEREVRPGQTAGVARAMLKARGLMSTTGDPAHRSGPGDDFELLSGLLAAEGVDPALAAREIKPRPPEAGSPLSFAQQRLWFLHQIDPLSSAYNLSSVTELDGPFQVAAFGAALSEVVRRHEALRTGFEEIDGQPVQVVAPARRVPLALIDLTEVARHDRRARVRALAAEQSTRPFTLARAPLLRACVVRFDADHHAVLLTVHHIVSDGWSMELMIRELAVLYTALSAGHPSPLPELAVQYADFAAWQRSWLSRERMEILSRYWKTRLAGAPALLKLPLDRKRPPLPENRGALRPYAIPRELADSLTRVARGQGATLFMVLLAAFKTLLHSYSGQEDVVVGTNVAGRASAEVESLIGFFINMLALRTDLSGNPTFLELLRRIRETTLEAYSHQEMPFVKLVDELRLERSLGHTPLFQAVLTLQSSEAPPGEWAATPDLTLRPVEIEEAAPPFDLIFNLSQTPAGVSGSVTYNARLFEAATITRLIERYSALLRMAAAAPERRLSEIRKALFESLPDEQEREFGVAARRALQSARRQAVAIKPKVLD
jgi:amino acid adenylation domain-containing protein/non-ribosomal peptide synthase protein (TIGR01720 family)